MISVRCSLPLRSRAGYDGWLGMEDYGAGPTRHVKLCAIDVQFIEELSCRSLAPCRF